MNWFSAIHSFDIVILIILLVLTARGIWTGFIRQIAFIIAMLLGFIVAGRLHGSCYHFILPFLNNPPVAFIISYVILFTVIYLAVFLVGLGLKKVVEITLLSWFDRSLGGLFGAAKGVFVSLLLFMLLSAVLPAAQSDFLRRSLSYPYLKVCSEYVLQFINDAGLRSYFLPKEPAIKDKEPGGTGKGAPEEGLGNKEPMREGKKI